MKKILSIIFTCLFLALFSLFNGWAGFSTFKDINLAYAQENTQEPKLIIHVFGSRTCPHCKAEREFLEQYQQENPQIKVYIYYIDKSNELSNSKLISEVAKELGILSGSVPVTIISDQNFIGFDEAETTGEEIKSLVTEALSDPNYQDIVAQVAKKEGIIPVFEDLSLAKLVTPEPTQSQVLDQELVKEIEQSQQQITLPVIGKVSLMGMSLPLLTLTLGLADGFNPCAMWTLLFLISLLLGLQDRKRMWILGITFIVASGFVYFLFMAAWLNFFLLVGMVQWVRIAIGLVALWAAYTYLKDYQTNKDGACKTDFSGKKQKVFAKLKLITKKESLVLALVGIVLLAFAVNLVEMVCSAGLPAIFTKALTLNNLAGWQYYAYILFYLLFFMADDIVVFVIAMKTLHSVGLDSKYARYSHLIGGILMLLIGLAMIFKPELLAFG